mmetsp:Transcript_6127/g.16578  ORF Transcript_6127/g.16578 Transcript_6127/m.16578 type:complete len:236 (-) Transcript_6127:348-1055(-)
MSAMLDVRRWSIRASASACSSRSGRASCLTRQMPSSALSSRRMASLTAAPHSACRAPSSRRSAIDSVQVFRCCSSLSVSLKLSSCLSSCLLTSNSLASRLEARSPRLVTLPKSCLRCCWPTRTSSATDLLASSAIASALVQAAVSVAWRSVKSLHALPCLFSLPSTYSSSLPTSRGRPASTAPTRARPSRTACCSSSTEAVTPPSTSRLLATAAFVISWLPSIDRFSFFRAPMSA